MKSKPAKTIFLIDDDELFRESVHDALSDRYNLLTAGSAGDARRLLDRSRPDLILLDIGLPDEDGTVLLKWIRGAEGNLPTVMLTAVGDIAKVVESIKLGAADYLTKPVSPRELRLVVERALESAELQAELQQRRRLQEISAKEITLVGESRELARIRTEIGILGGSDSTVLIQGETGTGKEIAARLIHNRSARGGKPFVAVNCGAIPRALTESEFFGHSDSAFTGARKKERGKFFLANHGTILLDEIGELSLEAQTTLLRVLEEKEFYPVGSNRLVTIDVRVLASTNRNLQDMVADKRFREDLFFRLNSCAIKIPPLRKRPDDIVPLAHHFMGVFNVKFQKQFRSISDGAKEALFRHHWKGNVRELRNVMERLILFEDGAEINPKHLGFMAASSLRKPPTTVIDRGQLLDEGLDKALEEFEKERLIEALNIAGRNKTEAAKLLKLSPPTFYYRLEKYGIK